MGIEKRPEKIRRAAAKGDVEQLRVYQERAVKARKKNEDARKATGAAAQRVLADEEWERRVQANEHIIPPPSPHED